jgi:hypothetical protein
MTGLDPAEVYDEPLDLPAASRAWLQAAQAYLPLGGTSRAAAAQESAFLGSMAVTASGLDEDTLRIWVGSLSPESGWRDDPVASLVVLAQAIHHVLVDRTWQPVELVDAFARASDPLAIFEVTRWSAKMVRDHPIDAPLFTALQRLAMAHDLAVMLTADAMERLTEPGDDG